MDSLPIPRSLDDVTAEWLGAALQAAGLDVTVTAVHQQVIAAGEGFMGKLARVTPTYETENADAPRSLIVKLPADDPGAQFMGQLLGVWHREARFYDEVAPHVALRIPRAWVNLADIEANAFCLVLEDLAPMQAADQVRGGTVEMSRQVVDEIAGFHATWWSDPRLETFDWMPTVASPVTESVVPMFEAGWGAFCDRYGERLPSRTLRWAEAFAPGAIEWLHSYASLPCTISHGDFRLDNMLFGADGSLALIDWQMATRCPGSADLVYYLSTNLVPEVRRSCEDELLTRYLQRLEEAGASSDRTGLDMEQLQRGYREGLVFWCVGMGGGLTTLDTANERGVALFDALVHRVFTAADDLDAGDWLA